MSAIKSPWYIIKKYIVIYLLMNEANNSKILEFYFCWKLIIIFSNEYKTINMIQLYKKAIWIGQHTRS